jgi:hypothetical protein
LHGKRQLQPFNTDAPPEASGNNGHLSDSKAHRAGQHHLKSDFATKSAKTCLSRRKKIEIKLL